jgi:uncharacterized protein (DUF1501 family)
VKEPTPVNPPIQDLSRRRFLGGAAGAAGVTAVAAAGTSVVNMGTAGAAAPASNRTVIVMFLRGGADGMSIVAPVGDPRYAALRPTIAVTPAVARPLAGPAPSTFFALHPAAVRLSQLYNAGRVAVVPAAGSPDPNRSHFEAQAIMESGILDQRAFGTGWGGRWLSATGADGDSALRSVAIGSGVPASLRGHTTVSANSVADLSLLDWGPPLSHVRANTTDLYQRTGVHPLLASWAQPTLRTLDDLAGLGSTALPTGWPDTSAGRALWPLARLVEAGYPLELGHADTGGWDTHEEMGVPGDANSRMNRLVSQLDTAIGAFFDRIGAAADRTTLVVMTEFGRRAYENASRGTDHGRAWPMLVIGGGVRPGVHGGWPGLADAQLDGGDLRVTSDYRQVLAEVLSRRLGATSGHLASVFPRYTTSPSTWLNVCT